MTSTTPPFRADHVGSFLRPKALLEARRDGGLELHSTSEARGASAITLERLREIENDAIREIVAFQEDVGLQSISDGEYRRGSWAYDLAARIDGVVLKRQEGAFDAAFSGPARARRWPIPRPSSGASRAGWCSTTSCSRAR